MSAVHTKGTAIYIDAEHLYTAVQPIYDQLRAKAVASMESITVLTDVVAILVENRQLFEKVHKFSQEPLLSFADACARETRIRTTSKDTDARRPPLDKEQMTLTGSSVATRAIRRSARLAENSSKRQQIASTRPSTECVSPKPSQNPGENPGDHKRKRPSQDTRDHHTVVRPDKVGHILSCRPCKKARRTKI